MPIENIIKSQAQEKLFGYKLKEELNANNKLYKLRELINWSRLEEWLSKNVAIKRLGRNRKCHRVMLGVTMLQAIYNFSDTLAEEELKKNMYWQYFCISLNETYARIYKRNIIKLWKYKEHS
ncbi:MAG: transposase [Rickettsia endosymbiont of Ecitomorpha arachnoides]|nr:transposase [Rickettsia endosymbiont of Ecitomorpha arachnoides]